MTVNPLECSSIALNIDSKYLSQIPADEADVNETLFFSKLCTSTSSQSRSDTKDIASTYTDNDSNDIIVKKSNKYHHEMRDSVATVFLQKTYSTNLQTCQEWDKGDDALFSDKKHSSKSEDEDFVVEYGRLIHDKALSSVFILDNVILPLLRQSNTSNSHREGSLRSALHLTYAKKFASRICRYTEQEKYGSRLQVPTDIDFSSMTTVVEDYIIIQRLERIAKDWFSSISGTIDGEMKQLRKSKGPMGEVDFWRRRHVVLADLVEQTKKTEVGHSLEALNLSGSPIYAMLSERISDLNKLSNEAAENAKFLSTLERHFRILNDGSLQSMINTIPAMVDGMKMIWTISRNYNRDARMVPLMERISYQLISRVRQFIDTRHVMKEEYEEIRQAVCDSKIVLELWKTSYLNTREQIEQIGSGQRRWEFDRQRLFEQTDYMAKICSDLLEVLETVHEFQRVLGPELISITDEGGGVDAVIAQVTELPKLIIHFENDTFDCKYHKEWSNIMNKFRSQVSYIEDQASKSIERAFQQLRSSEAAYNLVYKFLKLNLRPSLHRLIEARYQDILERYETELKRIHFFFNNNKNQPPISLGHEKTPGSITWSHDLYLRAKRPILIFQKHQGLLDSGKGKMVKETYLSFARSVDIYKDTLFKTWIEEAEIVAYDFLRRPLLVRLEEESSLAPSETTHSTKSSLVKRTKSQLTPSKNVTIVSNIHQKMSYEMLSVITSTLVTNFPSRVRSLINESKHLYQLGFIIPENILHLALQEEVYDSYIMELDRLTKQYNTTIVSLSVTELDILRIYIEQMDESLKAGLTNISWSSQRILAYISTSTSAIERFKSTLNEVRKCSISIDNIFNLLEKNRVFQNDWIQNEKTVPLNLTDFTQAIETQVTDKMKDIVNQFKSLSTFLIKIEMILSESETGSSTLIENYYSYCSKRMYNAAVQIVLRSFFTLLCTLLNISSSTPRCQMKINLVDKLLVIDPSLSNGRKYIYRSVRSLAEATKALVRWMNGTCLGIQISQKTDDMVGLTQLQSFYDDISRNKAIVTTFASLERIVSSLFKFVGDASSEVNTFYKIIDWIDPTWKVEADVFSEISLPSSLFEENLDLLGEDCIRFESLVKNLQNDPHRKKYDHFFNIDYSGIISGVNDRLKDRKDDILEELHIVAKRDLDFVQNNIESFTKLLGHEPETLESLKDVLKNIGTIQFADMDTKLKCRYIQERYEVLLKYNFLITEEEVRLAFAIESHWQNLVVNAKTKEMIIADTKESFKEVIQKQVMDFVETLDEKTDLFVNHGPGAISISLEKASEELDEWHNISKYLRGKYEDMSNIQDLLGTKRKFYPKLQLLERSLLDLNKIFSIYRDFMDLKSSLSTLPWESFDHLDVVNILQNLHEKCIALVVDCGKYALEKVQQRITDDLEAISIMNELQNDCIKDRHWEKLAELSGDLSFTPSIRMDVGSVFNLNLHRNPEKVKEVLNEAIQESKIEVSIADIESFWGKASIEVQRYGDGDENFLVLRSMDDLMIQLDDHLLNLQSISGSKFVIFFKDSVKAWETHLHIIMECFQTWYKVQRKWMYLESIFVGADDIKMQLREEANIFEKTSKSFQSIMKNTFDSAKVISCCTERRLKTLQDLFELLESCQKSLSDYLNTKRNAFPRFYFISDDELISIIGTCDLKGVQPHLLKLFENVKTIEFENDMKKYASIESSEGERFDVINEVIIDGPVEFWMNKLDDEIKYTLKKMTKEAIFRHDGKNRSKWIADKRCLGMNAICGSQTWWTWEVEHAFKRIANGDRHAMKDLNSKLSTQLNTMVDMVRSKLDSITRKKVNTLLIIDVHARDIVSSFVRESVVSEKQFEWESQLRVYWRRDIDDCVIKQCVGSFNYGYEYMGLNGRLVMTPLTDRCFMTLTQALTFKLGGSPSGPAGTGKTETVKDLAKALALPCYVINCGEGLDFKAIGSTFSGLIQSGGWGCFDEFNRINLEVLSVVSAQLRLLQNALLNDSSTVDIGIGERISIRKLRGQATCGIFITMNPGYAGRTELPDNLKALFRPVSMTTPDLINIAENMLFSEGFQESKVLAKKIVSLYEVSQSFLSKQYHYDFGLRSMKAVLTMAGTIKRDNDAIPEDEILIRSLLDANLPKFIQEDVKIYEGLISDMFPCMSKAKAGTELFQGIVYDVMDRGGYRCSDVTTCEMQANKVIQLHQTQQSRHTTMIVGPTCSGKSVILDLLIGARQIFDGTSIKISTINPKSQNIQQLYGTLDENTRDWTDGILSSIFRTVNQPLPPHRTKEEHWIVFDGDIDALWVENLNSVMDDNRLLTLPNGERIRLQRHCSLICEVFDLQYASPATISRCGMIWVDSKNLGCWPYYERWIKKRYGDNYQVTPSLERRANFMNILYEKFTQPTLNYILSGYAFGEMKDKLSKVLLVCDLELCKQLCYLLDSLLPEPSNEDELSETKLINLYILAIVWSIGTIISQESREQFNLFLHQLTTEVKIPSNSIFDHYYAIDDGEWHNWNEKVSSFKTPHLHHLESLYIPTRVSVMYDHLLERVLPHSPILLIGDSGTTKTTVVDKFMQRSDLKTHHTLSIKLSYRTKGDDLKSSITSNIEKRVGSTFGAPYGKNLLIFMDDLHMPKVDEYGTREPLALLLTLIDHAFMYTNEKEINRVTIKNLHIIATVKPSQGGKESIDPRLISKFSKFYMPPLSEEILEHIFNSIAIDRIKVNNENVEHDIVKVTNATLQVYFDLKNKFQPSPSKFHYIFTIRDLSRIYEGLLSTSCFSETKDLIRLWRNEVNRTFFDRLVSDDDFSKANAKVIEVLNLHFEPHAAYALKEPLLFGSFPDLEVNQDISHPKTHNFVEIANYSSLQQKMKIYLDLYNESHPSNRLSIVLFDDALNHITRLSRVLMRPNGHLLLIGVGGSGKRLLTRLATFSRGHELFEIRPHRGYSELDFIEDVKVLYRKTLISPIVFLITEEDIFNDKILEIVCSMLSNHILSNLFSNDEKEEICEKLESNPSTWDSIVCTMKRNLHIVMALSPSGDALRLKCRNFPVLLSECVVDWFSPWPSDALHLVTRSYLAGDNLYTDSLDEITKHTVMVHSTIEKYAARFRKETKRLYFITPKSFITYILSFMQQIRSSIQEHDSASKRLNCGLSKLSEAFLSIEAMKTELSDKKVVVDAKTVDVKNMIEAIQLKTEIAENASKAAAEKQNLAESDAIIIENEKNKADSALMEALPAVEAAAEALNNLRREDLQELKAFNNPPIHVKIVCQMCSVLRPTGEILDESWTDSKKMLSNTKLLDLLKDYKKDEISEKMYQRCQRILKENSAHDMSVENMASKSQAGKGLLVWVLAVLRYYEIAKDVEPLRQKVKEMQKAQAQTEGELRTLRDKIKKLDQELFNLREAYKVANGDLSELQVQASQMEAHLTAATQMLEGLEGEKLRWENEAILIRNSRSKFIGNSLISAGSMTYLGAFSAEFRSEILCDCFLADLEMRCIDYSENFRLDNELISKSELQSWNACGLPSDDYSTQNGIITMKASRYPLCIDPQQQASSWIKKSLKDNNLTVKSMYDEGILKHLELAIQFGNPFLFENVGEEIDPILNNILDRNLTMLNGQATVLIGDKSISWDENFRVFFCTKLSNPSYSPETMTKLNVVNYCVTVEGLSDQLLNIVVAHERPDLEAQFNDLIKEMAKDSKNLKSLEDSLLKELSSATGNILDNKELISKLNETSTNAEVMKEKLCKANQTKTEILRTRDVFKTVSKRGAILYFGSQSLTLLNLMYGMSLDIFMEQFQIALDKSQPSSDLKCRLEHMIYSCTRQLYSFTSAGIFEEDKLIFAFQLTFMILSESYSVNQKAIRFFLNGNTSIDKDLSSKFGAKPIHWVSDGQWKDLLSLVHVSPLFVNIETFLELNSLKIKDWSCGASPEEVELRFENDMPIPFIEKMCLLKVLRPDRCYNAAKSFIVQEMGNILIDSTSLNYKTIYNQSTSTRPTIFILSPGADPQPAIQTLGKNIGFATPNKLQFISLGQGQGPIAMGMLHSAMNRGSWLMIQNCHLLMTWLIELDLALDKMVKPHTSFRLWLTTEPIQHFPQGLLQKSFKVVIEAPEGIKHNMLSTISKLSPNMFQECPHPAYKTSLYVLVYLHAVLQERRKYGKIGWNINYDFNESDFQISQKLMSFYLTKYWEGDKDVLPWGSLQYLIGEVMYGGRVSDDMDRRVLKTYLNEFLGDFLFNSSQRFSFSKDGFDYDIPEQQMDSLDSWLDFVHHFPDSTTPGTLGLHPNAEISYSTDRSNHLCASLIALHGTATELTGGKSHDERIQDIAKGLINMIPIYNPDLGTFDVEKIRNEMKNEDSKYHMTPNQVVLIQELNSWNALSKEMYNSLSTLLQALNGEVGMSDYLQEIGEALDMGYIPKSWKRLAPPTLKMLASWTQHFKCRYEQYVKWIKDDKYRIFWIGGLHSPRNFLSALILMNCRQKSLPVDQTTLYTDITTFRNWEEALKDIHTLESDSDLYIHGLYLQGAGWDLKECQLCQQRPNEIMTEMPYIRIKAINASELNIQNKYTTPVYMTSSRRSAGGDGLIFEAYLKTDIHPNFWVLQGVAITLNTSD